MTTTLKQVLAIVAAMGMAAGMASAQQYYSELKCNVGPVSVSSGGSVGVSGGGGTVSYNPSRQEVCAGGSVKGGAVVYGEATAQVCTDTRGNGYVKVGGGPGFGVGADAASVGCTVMTYARIPVPRSQPQQMPAYSPASRPVPMPAHFPGPVPTPLRYRF